VVPAVCGSAVPRGGDGVGEQVESGIERFQFPVSSPELAPETTGDWKLATGN
jgi:hypothetical protein